MTPSTSPKLTDMLSKFDDSKRAVANLMARENITVQIVDGTPTATFNPTTRVLTVPNWQGLSIEQCDLMMSHEVGHALFTDRKVDLASLSRGLHTYLNVVEDARIERRMKGAFPGLAPTFYKGYRDFHANGPILKGTQDSMISPSTGKAVPVATMRLIDRINLHYKIGAFVNVPFTAAERVWLSKIDRSTSTEECLEIAKALYAEQKEQDKQDKQDKQDRSKSTEKQKTQKSRKQEETESSDDQDQDDKQSESSESNDQDSDSDSDDQDGDSDSTEGDEESNDDADDADDQDGDSDSDDQQDGDSDSDSDDQDGDDQDGDSDSDSDDQQDGESQDGDSDSDSDPSAETMQDAEDALREIASKEQSEGNRIHHLLYPVWTDAEIDKRVITAAAFTTSALEALKGTDADLTTLENEWNSRFLATAKQLAVEFERRKSARAMQYAKPAKSGKIDFTKLANYKFAEDIFKATLSVPNGKSHGVVMLIDGSGSMSSQFASVLDQVMLFAQFAFQVNIPFEAYMFSDCAERADDAETFAPGLNALALDSRCTLVGLVNTTTDRAMFKKNMRVLLAVRKRYAAGYYNTDNTVSQAFWNAVNRIPNTNLSGTPLFTGMLIAEHLLGRMKRNLRLDKTTFFVLTDGEDTHGLMFKTNQPRRYSYAEDGYERLTSEGFVIRDQMTKRNMTFVQSGTDYRGRPQTSMPENAILTMLFDVLKLRYDARTVYIYLQEGRRMFSGYRRRYRRYAPTTVSSVAGLSYMTRCNQTENVNNLNVDAMKEAMKADGQFVLPTGLGVADLNIILPQGSVELTEDAFAKLDTENLTQRKIAAEFTKLMTKAVANRKFVNSVIPHLI